MSRQLEPKRGAVPLAAISEAPKDLPRVRETLRAGQICGEIESTKSVSDLFNPVNGEVVEINKALADDSAAISTDPYGAGWLFRIRLDGPVDLLDAAAYAALTEEKSSRTC
jgi:glycine cleavage system H protein